MRNPKETDRRMFLKTGILAATATAFPDKTAQAAAPPEKSIVGGNKKIPTRAFGKTGHTLPILGMGGSAMIKIFTASYGVQLKSEEDRMAMVRHAYDRGIRYFDTARGYFESERIMGGGLQGIRDQVYLATKCHAGNPTKVRAMVERSLADLRTDYLDCVQIHSPVIESVGFEKSMKIHAELEKLRDEKMLRYIGLTTHVAFETVLKMIETRGFDQVLLAYGYFRKGMVTLLSNRKLEYRDLCLAKAHELGMAIVAMKILGANIMSHNARNIVPDYDKAKLEKLATAAIRWVARDERVSMLNIGVSLDSDIDKNVQTLSGDLSLTNEDRSLLADFSTLAYQSSVVKKMKTS